MAAANWLRYFYRAHLSRPKSVRPLYRLVNRQAVTRIVEVGISDMDRAIAMIEVAQRAAGDKPVLYTAIDWFEAREKGLPPISLKEAYKTLRATGATVRLVPGAPGAALASAANAHQNTDLLLFAPSVADSDLERAWFFVPRMLHANSVIWRETKAVGADPVFSSVSRTQIAELACRDVPRRAAA